MHILKKLIMIILLGVSIINYAQELKFLEPWKGLDQSKLGANEAGDEFGYSLVAGDFNGDGHTDLAVGAPGEAPGSNPKSGYIFCFRNKYY